MKTTTKVQRIVRKNSEQWYVTLPVSIAQTMGFTQSEAVEWTVTDEHHLILSRSLVAPFVPVTPVPTDVGVKKKLVGFIRSAGATYEPSVYGSLRSPRVRPTTPGASHGGTGFAVPRDSHQPDLYVRARPAGLEGRLPVVFA